MQSFKQLADYISNNTTLEGYPSDHVCIIIDNPKYKWNDKAEYLATLTWYTLIKWRYKIDGNWNGVNNNIIFADTLDEALQRVESYKYALVTYAGSFFTSVTFKSNENINEHFDKFKESGLPCKAHIIWRPSQKYPSFHLQTLFLNLDIWRAIGKPRFAPYTGIVHMPERCTHHVHDDYTPIEARPSGKRSLVVHAPCAEYISALMKHDYTIHNFNNDERSSKFFAYPELDEKRNQDWCKSLQHVRELHGDYNVIYLNNNERFRDSRETNITEKFDVIYTHAGGAAAEFLWSEYGHADTKLVIYDAHAPTIEWKQQCYNLANSYKDIERLAEKIAHAYDAGLDEGKYKPVLIEENKRIFPAQKWIECFDKIKYVEFVHKDIVFDDPLAIDTSKRCFLYMSNIFSYPPVIHKGRINVINDRFRYYLNLPNTLVCGEDPFMHFKFKDNISKT